MGDVLESAAQDGVQNNVRRGEKPRECGEEEYRERSLEGENKKQESQRFSAMHSGGIIKDKGI